MPNSPNIQDVFIYLSVSKPKEAIAFYKQVFDAKELMILTGPHDEIAHAEIKIGPAIIMLSGEYPDYDIRSPKFYGGSPVRIHLHVDNVDSLAKQAEKSGAEILIQPNDQPHGERQCKFRDPFGYIWLLGHEIEKLTPEEMQQRINNVSDS